jgi:two-component system response regulator FlrC
VGKEVLARFVHRNSARAGGPFVAINCAAIPENLLEATLFGYEKGAFTGAAAPHAGKFEQAQGGTLLLDEISEMPAALQAKLLRVLQEREVERVGGKRPIALDVRILATSNRDLQAEVQSGRFREDLYYRLNVFPLHVPPLRERVLDIVPLAQRVLQRAAQGRMLTLSASAEAGLTAYSWRGNIRELENVIQRAVILAPGGVIELEHLWLPGVNAGTARTPGEAARTAGAGSPPVTSTPGSGGEPGKAYPSDLKSLERTHILETLAAVNGVRKAAAERLGMSERTLRYKLAQYRLEAAGGKPEAD